MASTRKAKPAVEVKGPLAQRFAREVRPYALVRVDAEYRTISGSSRTRWMLRWSDGPNEAKMRRLVRAAAKRLDVPDPRDALEFDRLRSDRAQLAAWALRHENSEHDPRMNTTTARFEAEACHDLVCFPDDLGPEDPLWELADLALEATSRHGWSDVPDAVVWIARRGGVHGLRMDTWIAARATADSKALPPPPPVLPEVPDALTGRLEMVLEAIVTHLAGGGDSARDPVARVLAWERVRELVPRLVDDADRAAAVQAVAQGIPLYRLAELIGWHRSTLIRRWPGGRFDTELAPRAWMRDHADDWKVACRALLDAVGGLRGPMSRGDHSDLLRALSTAIDQARDWTGLSGTPDTARALAVAVRKDKARQARDTWRIDSMKLEPELDAALDALDALIVAHDTALPPRRRGGAHP